MKVWIGNTALISVRLVNCKICNHTIRNKVFLDKFSCQLDVFFLGKFILQSHVKAVSKLCIVILFYLFHLIP